MRVDTRSYSCINKTKPSCGGQRLFVALIGLIGYINIGIADEKVNLQILVNNPESYIDKRIVIASLACVDDPKGGYLCSKTIGGQILRIRAEALGSKTDDKVAQRLLSDCFGTANLKRSTCRVDAIVVPTSAKRDLLETPNGSMPIALIECSEIEMYEPAPNERKKSP